MPELPEEISEIGFEFSWDNEKVWALDVPNKEVPSSFLEWHFDVKFLDARPGEHYNLTPWEFLKNPDEYRQQQQRTQQADLAFPIDYMQWKGRPLILDGLHRLIKSHSLGFDLLSVREIPVSMINQIKRDDNA